MKHPTKLQVRLPGRVVGVLEQHKSGVISWTPEPSWQTNPLPPLGADPALRQSMVTTNGLLPPWFENLLPEYDARQPKRLRQYICERLNIKPTQSFRLLAALGRDLPGAVELSVVDEAPSAPQLRSDAEAEDPSVRFSSVAGMQLKFSMSLVQDGFVLGAQRGARQFLVKLPGRFDGSGGADLVAVEYATMNWARASGFSVPHHEIVGTQTLHGIDEGWVASKTAFAIERFDRPESGAKVHIEDLCQALGLPPSSKYGELEKGTFGAHALVKFLTDQGGESVGREAARRLGFIIASGNNDAHLKNWSLLWGAGPRPSLTPCYDFVATVAWPDAFGWGLPGGPSLPLRFGREKYFRLLDAIALKEFAKRAEYPWVLDEFFRGIDAALHAWPTIAPSAPTAMREALEEHWEKTPCIRDRR